MCDTCDDSPFELIEKYKQKLLDATNIGDSPEEMAVIDNILFRFWQMGWLKDESSEQPRCEDAVSREAVLNELDAWEKDLKEICHHQTAADLKLINQSMESLPSAQPSATDTNVAATDTISRQAAIDKFEPWLKVDGYSEGELNMLKAVLYELRVLPSAQSGRKKGKWIYNSPVTMRCNQCGFVIKDWDWHRFKYCPNCIADMRGESNG